MIDTEEFTEDQLYHVRTTLNALFWKQTLTFGLTLVFAVAFWTGFIPSPVNPEHAPSFSRLFEIMTMVMAVVSGLALVIFTTLTRIGLREINQEISVRSS